jgi:hypothetical protein
VTGLAEGLDTYTLVGPAYVHGIMDGELVSDITEGKLKEQDIMFIQEKRCLGG